MKLGDKLRIVVFSMYYRVLGLFITVSQMVMVQHLPTDTPGLMMCPRCQNTVLTKLEYKYGVLTWVLFALFFVLL